MSEQKPKKLFEMLPGSPRRGSSAEIPAVYKGSDDACYDCRAFDGFVELDCSCLLGLLLFLWLCGARLLIFAGTVVCFVASWSYHVNFYGDCCDFVCSVKLDC